MRLLANLQITKSRRSFLSVAVSYFPRWRVGETIRPVPWPRAGKQTYRIDDIRLRKHDRFRNAVNIALAAAHFAGAWMGGGLKLGTLAHRGL